LSDEIRTEMTASVWKVVAAPGQSVEEGDEIVVLESMKMEIPVLAPRDGVVTEMSVSEGQQVTEGDLIAVMDRS